MFVWLRCRRRVMAEIETREQALEATRRANEKYRSIVENAVEGIFQTTLAGGYLIANPALARIYGYESPEHLLTSVNFELTEHQARAAGLAGLLTKPIRQSRLFDAIVSATPQNSVRAADLDSVR